MTVRQALIMSVCGLLGMAAGVALLLAVTASPPSAEPPAKTSAARAPAAVIAQLDQIDHDIQRSLNRWPQPKSEELYYEYFMWFEDAHRYVSDMRMYAESGRDRATLDQAWITRVRREVKAMLPPRAPFSV